MNKFTLRDLHRDKVPFGPIEFSGWIRTHRRSKQVAFIDVTDGTTVQGLQLVLNPESSDFAAIESKLSTGAAIKIAGNLKESPAKGQKFEVDVSSIELIGEANPETYPLQKKGHTLEFLREHMHLRPRSNTFGAVFRLRSAAAMAVHRFYQDRGFYYVHTPIITTSDCEGAGEMFRVTTLDMKNPPKINGEIDYSQDFFKEAAGLTVSGQLEGEIYATAISNIYTFGPTFRAENSNTTRHLSEFWMIEPEMAFYDLNDNMSLAEDFIRYMIRYVLDECPEEMKFFQERDWTTNDHVDVLEKVASTKFERMDYSDAIKALEKSGKSFEFPVKWGIDLQSEHERWLTDEYIKGPVFVVNYPKDIKAFYMRLNEDGKTVRAMDCLVPRLGEVIGGSQREERLDQLQTRMKQMNIPEENLWWYLELRKFGTVPHAGFGLGFERFLMYVTGMQNIRDVISFPRHPGFAKF
jgi:asparaginyl-tRNA synthetase